MPSDAERNVLLKAAACAWGVWTLGGKEVAAGETLERQGLGKVIFDDSLKDPARHFRINEFGKTEAARLRGPDE